MRYIQVAALLLAVAAAGCSSSETSTMPGTPSSTTLTGTWSGDLALLGTSARMTWTLTQTNSAIAGPVLVLLPTGTVLMNGVLSGTVSGSAVTYTIAISPGGIPSQPNCVGQLTGNVTSSLAAVSTLTGAYTVASSTCSTPFSTGTFTLTRTM